MHAPRSSVIETLVEIVFNSCNRSTTKALEKNESYCESIHSKHSRPMACLTSFMLLMVIIFPLVWKTRKHISTLEDIFRPPPHPPPKEISLRAQQTLWFFLDKTIGKISIFLFFPFSVNFDYSWGKKSPNFDITRLIETSPRLRL